MHPQGNQFEIPHEPNHIPSYQTCLISEQPPSYFNIVYRILRWTRNKHKIYKVVGLSGDSRFRKILNNLYVCRKKRLKRRMIEHADLVNYMWRSPSGRGGYSQYQSLVCVIIFIRCLIAVLWVWDQTTNITNIDSSRWYETTERHVKYFKLNNISEVECLWHVLPLQATDVDTGSGGNVTYTLQGDQT